MRSAKPEPFVKQQGGICLYHTEGERLAGSRCLFDQAFNYLSANALPSQSAVYEQLAEEPANRTSEMRGWSARVAFRIMVWSACCTIVVSPLRPLGAAAKQVIEYHVVCCTA